MSKVLVAYFSATGTTAAVAAKLARVAGADLFEIEPVSPYTQADLDWKDKGSRSTIEMEDESCRPKIAVLPTNMDSYDVVFLGFPIWWYVEPRIVDSFLESCDLADKTIVPFATSGGSGFGRATQRMRSLAPDAKVVTGKMLNGDPSEEKLRAWAQKEIAKS